MSGPGPARQLARLVADGTLSATDVAHDHLARIGANGALNAFTSIDRDLVMRRAAAVDAARESGQPVGPMLGVPVAVKDLLDVGGETTTCGSSFYRHHAVETAPALAAIEAAHGVLFGRTGLHEFAFGFSSENHWFGPVRNPWDLASSPGGSSGGSAAAVAAGLTPIAIGTDTGGSVRVPAALCGIAGLKVTHGRISLDGVFPLAGSLDTVGPLGTCVDDLSLAYHVMIGEESSDDSVAATLAEMSFGVPSEWLDRPLGEDVQEAFSNLLVSLRAAGAQVEWFEAPDLVPSDEINAGAYPEIAQIHRAWFEEDPDRYGPEVRRRLANAMAVGLDEFGSAQQWRARIAEILDEVTGRYSGVLTPATAVTKKVIGVDVVRTPAGTEHYRGALSAFSALVNHGGHPALVLPLAASGSPPPAVQIVGARWAEDALLEVGTALEEAHLCRFRPPAGF